MYLLVWYPQRRHCRRAQVGGEGVNAEMVPWELWALAGSNSWFARSFVFVVGCCCALLLPAPSSQTRRSRSIIHSFTRPFVRSLASSSGRLLFNNVFDLTYLRGKPSLFARSGASQDRSTTVVVTTMAEVCERHVRVSTAMDNDIEVANKNAQLAMTRRGSL